MPGSGYATAVWSCFCSYQTALKWAKNSPGEGGFNNEITWKKCEPILQPRCDDASVF